VSHRIDKNTEPGEGLSSFGRLKFENLFFPRHTTEIEKNGIAELFLTFNHMGHG
jgi:hypothetical protein